MACSYDADVIADWLQCAGNAMVENPSLVLLVPVDVLHL